MSIYKFLDYTEVLAAQIQMLKLFKKVNYSSIAKAAVVQKSYVTKVFNRNSDFSSDQLFNVCVHLEITGDEKIYIFLLLELARSSLRERRKELRIEIRAMQQMKSGAKEAIKYDRIGLNGDEAEAERYYLDPYSPIIHNFLAIKKYQRNPQLIGEALGISKQRLEMTLKALTESGVVVSKNGKLHLQKEHLFLDTETSIYKAHSHMMKTMCINHQLKTPSERQHSLNLTFSATQCEKNTIQQEFVKFLERAGKLIVKADSMEVFQMNFDLFSWEP